MNRVTSLERELAALERDYTRRTSRGEVGLMAVVMCGLWAVIGGLTVYAAMTW